MYKNIKKTIFQSIEFNKTSNDLFAQNVSRLLDCVEYTLWRKYLINNPQPLGHELIHYYLVNYLNAEENWEILDLDLSHQTCVELLDSMLTTKMEEFLTSRVSLKEIRENKKVKSSLPPVTFREYLLENERVQFNMSTYKDSLQVVPGLTPEMDKRPLYFLLYRLRNNILHSISSRSFSIMYINKSLEGLTRELNKLLVNRLLYGNNRKLSMSSLDSIYKEYEKTLIYNYASEQRGGKNEEEGTRLFEQTMSRIRESVQIKQLANSHGLNFVHILTTDLDETTLKDWSNAYQQDFYKAAEENTQDFATARNLIRFSDPSFSDLRRIIVRTILDQGNPKELIEKSYFDVKPEEIIELFNRMYEERLLEADYTVAFHVKNFRAESSFTRLEINDIAFMSDAFFEGWKMGLKAQEKGERPTIIRSSVECQEDHIWVLVHNIKAGSHDIDMASQLGKTKLLNCLNLMSYFSVREDGHRFKIAERCFTYNHDFYYFGYSDQDIEHLGGAKAVDELEQDLVDFLARFFEKDYNWKDSILEAVQHFDLYCRSFDIEEQIKHLKSLILSLFVDNENTEWIAGACSILIAGTNYQGTDVTYLEMRKWLFEDFVEFLKVADDPKKKALKERIIERFKVFCQKVFATVLFNLHSLDKNIEEVTLTDIVEWLLFVYPDNRLIGEVGEDGK
ncbi:hypothetical protein ABE82_26315 (plasmid) [Paenibacillus peoriae]|uniref:hypothetical protein n=1 Tax=Paenibacillus peoriae TaxID=59893 RepID=UPI00071ED360|nr:hypothetical protein [Paenibacillus peoriae]ALS09932.1 hypothetical protein ABE82_26315 [Paenibacillus peoriae]